MASNSNSSSSSTDPGFEAYNIVQGMATVAANFLRSRRENGEATAISERQRRGTTGKRQFVDRDHVSGAARLFNDYFAEQPVYGPTFFRRRFRMRNELFLRIVNAVETHDPYFRNCTDVLGKPSLTPLQKCTSAVRQLAYGGAADMFDEYLRMGASTPLECLRRFCAAVVAVFSAEYLRRPTTNDVAWLLRLHEQKHGFPGMLGSIDCMHWAWKNCPKAYAAAYTRGDQGEPTMILEAVASHDLWIWHAYFGVPGSNNDINVLNASNLFQDSLQGNAPRITFQVNGSYYTQGYYLADGIYPDWPVFVKSLPSGVEPDKQRFSKQQESARKDIERAFGVLRQRWHVVKGPARGWYKDNLRDIMLTCIIMHNMIIENEGEHATNFVDEGATGSSSSQRNDFQPNSGLPVGFGDYLTRYTAQRDKAVAKRLQDDLVAHFWQKYGPVQQDE